MVQLTINLPAELYAFVKQTAERETRSVALQVHHYIAEAARRAGTKTGINPKPGQILEPFPPPLPVQVSAENLPEAKEQLAELESERARLEEFNRSGGAQLQAAS